jgi:hypothetical protein
MERPNGEDMNDEELTLYAIKQAIAKLDQERRIRIEALAITLRNIVKDDPDAALAFALVGAEMAARSVGWATDD